MDETKIKKLFYSQEAKDKSLNIFHFDGEKIHFIATFIEVNIDRLEGYIYGIICEKEGTSIGKVYIRLKSLKTEEIKTAEDFTNNYWEKAILVRNAK